MVEIDDLALSDYKKNTTLQQSGRAMAPSAFPVAVGLVQCDWNKFTFCSIITYPSSFCTLFSARWMNCEGDLFTYEKKRFLLHSHKLNFS